MKPQDFLKEFNRMCGLYKHSGVGDVCNSDCPMHDKDCWQGKIMDTMHPENFAEAYDIVSGWSDKHPAKTRQSEFLKHYPNAFVCENFLHIDPCLVDKSIKENRVCYFFDCETCRRKYWLEPIESEGTQ